MEIILMLNGLGEGGFVISVPIIPTTVCRDYGMNRPPTVCSETTRPLQQIKKFLSAQLNIMQDAPKQAKWNILAAMHGNDCRPSIGMAKVEVAAFLADSLKPKTL